MFVICLVYGDCCMAFGVVGTFFVHKIDSEILLALKPIALESHSDKIFQEIQNHTHMLTLGTRTLCIQLLSNIISISPNLIWNLQRPIYLSVLKLKEICYQNPRQGNISNMIMPKILIELTENLKWNPIVLANEIKNIRAPVATRNFQWDRQILKYYLY